MGWWKSLLVVFGDGYCPGHQWRAGKRHISYMKAVCCILLSPAVWNVCNRSMPISLAGCMILQDRYVQRIFQREVSLLPTACISPKHSGYRAHARDFIWGDFRQIHRDECGPSLYGRERSCDSHLAWSDAQRSLKRCVDWSQIDKNEYLAAMRESVIDGARIKALVKLALTDKIDDREMFMKGIDYSYYYEQNDW